MNNEEKWIEMWEFEDRYEVSNLGNVRNTKTEKLLAIRNEGNAYRMVTIWNGKVHTKRVGRLIWQSFNKCNCDETVEHINQKGNDDRLENLECISMKKNYENRNEIPRNQNRYNLSSAIKGDIQLGMENNIINKNKIEMGLTELLKPSYTSWDVMKRYGVPLNYISTIFKRGSWKKYLKK